MILWHDTPPKPEPSFFVGLRNGLALGALLWTLLTFLGLHVGLRMAEAERAEETRVVYPHLNDPHEGRMLP